MSSGMATHGCCYMCTCICMSFIMGDYTLFCSWTCPDCLVESVSCAVNCHWCTCAYHCLPILTISCVRMCFACQSGIFYCHIIICLFDGTLLFVVCPLSVVHLFVGMFTCCTFVCWYVRVLDVCLFVGMWLSVCSSRCYIFSPLLGAWQAHGSVLKWTAPSAQCVCVKHLTVWYPQGWGQS